MAPLLQNPMENDFWIGLDELIKNSQVIIDRPAGTQHPHHPGMIYPLDYGYLSQTTTSDGEELDLFRGSEPEQTLNALVCSFDLQKKEVEIKLLIGCTEDEQRRVAKFLRSQSLPVFLVPRAESPISWLLSRRSIRRFKKEPVPIEMIETLLEAAIRAPSAHNRQPARFVVIQERDAKLQLAEAMGIDFLHDLLQDGYPESEARRQVERSWQRITEAPTGILVCLDLESLDDYPDPKRQEAEYKMVVQGVAMSAENLLLAAHCLNLGAVWMCAPLFAPESVRISLDLPDSWEPQGLVLVGYPEKYPEGRSRRSYAEVTRFY